MIILFVGGVTFAAGVVLVLRHLHVFRKQFDASSEELERRYLVSQVRRRCLTSAALALLGLVLCSMYWTQGADTPIPFTLLVLAALILIAMILTMATLDILSIRFVMAQQKRSMDLARQALQREHDRLKKKAREAKKKQKK